MKSVKSIQFLENLEADVRRLILTANHLSKTDPEVLMIQPGAGKWSVAQVLEHLNSYGRYYLPALEKSLQQNKPAVSIFKPGLFGGYFTKMMRPNAKGIVANKMQSPKDHRPAPDVDIKPVMDEFLEQQNRLLDLLELAKEKNINAIRTSISISRFIKLKSGDTFGFLIAHEERHFVQIINALEAIKTTTGRFQEALQAV